MGSGIDQAASSIDTLKHGFSVAGKKVFGDKDATNSMLNGQVVATGTPGASVVKDPNLGQSPLRHGIQSSLFSGAQGYGQAQQPQLTQRGGASPINIPQAPQVDPSFFKPNKLGMQQGPNPNSLFYGGGY